MSPLSLYELNSLVREVLALQLPETYWVVAEISELRVAGNGHCYVEFVEKEEKSGKLRAKARGNIWRDTYALLAPYFEEQTGMPLAAGLKVLVEVSAEFHPLYGYALTVCDIDPSYTLGAVAQRRKEILTQLEKEGVRYLNQELRLPRPMLRLAVVSSASAAGYGDFCDQLRQSGMAFAYELFPAVMQGEQVEQSVINALNEIASRQEDFDVAVIIRGGGAVSDLNGFESYELAANVAQFPLPVLTGIGHERDDTVIDFVAHTRLKTPTAVAAFLIEAAAKELQQLDVFVARLTTAAKQMLLEKRNQLSSLTVRLVPTAKNALSEKRQIFSSLAYRYRTAATRYCARERMRLELLMESRLRTGVLRRIEAEQHRIDTCTRTIKMASPERILSLGYTLTTCNGRIVSKAAELPPDAILTTRFSDGEIKSMVLPN